MRHMQFIEAYKKLENAISGIESLDDRTVVGFENAMVKNNSELNMLRYCRYTRNYIQHNVNYEKFVAVTSEMVAFLEKETAYAMSLRQSVKDVMKRPKPLPENADIVDVAKALKRAPLAIAALKGTVTAAYDETALRDAVIAGKLPMTVPSRIRFVKDDTPIDGLNGLYVVTDNGTKKGKYIGVLKV